MRDSIYVVYYMLYVIYYLHVVLKKWKSKNRIEVKTMDFALGTEMLCRINQSRINQTQCITRDRKFRKTKLLCRINLSHIKRYTLYLFWHNLIKKKRRNFKGKHERKSKFWREPVSPSLLLQWYTSNWIPFTTVQHQQKINDLIIKRTMIN